MLLYIASLNTYVHECLPACMDTSMRAYIHTVHTYILPSLFFFLSLSLSLSTSLPLSLPPSLSLYTYIYIYIYICIYI